MIKIARLFLFLIFICLTACAPKLRIQPGVLPTPDIPSKQLKAEAENYVRSYIDQENLKKINSGQEYTRGKNLVEKLARAAGYPANTFPVHVVDAGEEVNAAAVNGASIIIYKEMLKRVPNDAELATVIGHEIGHIIAKHYKDAEEEKKRASAVSVGSSILGVITSVAASAAGYHGASDLAGDAVEGVSSAVGYGAFVGQFSRTQEYEADHLGLLIMAKAGFDPRIAPKFWEKSEKIFGSSNSKVGAFFSTHPAESNRKEELEKAMPLALKLYKGKK
jgi:predicted Zn-dependent protease